MGVLARERARDRIAELARRGHDLVAFWQACTEVLEAAVPHYDKPCWYTLDPASLLITSHFHDGLPAYPAKMLRHEDELAHERGDGRRPGDDRRAAGRGRRLGGGRPLSRAGRADVRQ